VRPLRLYRVSAIVLRSRDLGEADRLLTLFSPERGKLSAVAKGARRPRSKLAAGLQLFTHSDLQLAVGANLDIVTQVVIRHAFYPLRQDLTRLAYASYFVELTDRLTEERSPQRRLFALLRHTLLHLENGLAPVSLARGFELRAMSLLGYEPELLSCVSCRRPIAPGPTGFSPALGGVICPRCRAQHSGLMPLSADSRGAMQQLLGLTVAAVPRLDISSRAQAELERTLCLYLEYRLDHRLNSRRFLGQFAVS